MGGRGKEKRSLEERQRGEGEGRRREWRSGNWGWKKWGKGRCKGIATSSKGERLEKRRKRMCEKNECGRLTERGSDGGRREGEDEG